MDFCDSDVPGIFDAAAQARDDNRHQLDCLGERIGVLAAAHKVDEADHLAPEAGISVRKTNRGLAGEATDVNRAKGGAAVVDHRKGELDATAMREVCDLESGLRLVGYGPQVDELVLGMNRAAEQAAPAAKQIFWDAIGDMTIDDSRKILGGAPTAATDYFKAKTTGRLTTAFKPIVDKSMSQVGVTRQYDELLGRAKAIPFLNVEQYDLDNYVVGKSLDGLFHVVGEQEKNIRANPSARVTDLLKEVFGHR